VSKNAIIGLKNGFKRSINYRKYIQKNKNRTMRLEILGFLNRVKSAKS